MLRTVTSTWRRLASKLHNVADFETRPRKARAPLAKKKEQQLETWEGEGGKTGIRLPE